MKYLVLILFLFVACKKDFKSPAIEAQYDKVMVIHDEVMPEISTINRLKRKIKKQSSKDSISLSLITQLDKAEDVMMDWMAEFKLDHSMSIDAQMSYLDKEEIKISEVSRIMKASISKGKEFLKTIEE